MKIKSHLKTIVFNKFNLCCLLAAAAIAFAGCASEHHEGDEGDEGHEHHHHSKLAAQAKISEDDARATVMNKFPDAKIREGELEREHGKLIWSFDIDKHNAEGVGEVNIDAITGDVVAVEKAGNDKD